VAFVRHWFLDELNAYEQAACWFHWLTEVNVWLPIKTIKWRHVNKLRGGNTHPEIRSHIVSACYLQTCGYWWCCCWTRCRCLATFCCFVSLCSSSSESSVFNCGPDFCVNAVYSNFQTTSPSPSPGIQRDWVWARQYYYTWTPDSMRLLSVSRSVKSLDTSSSVSTWMGRPVLVYIIMLFLLCPSIWQAMVIV